MSAYLDRPLRTLRQYRDQLVAELRALPLGDRRAGRLAKQIVDLEDEIERLAERLAPATLRNG